jgi:hypothetical protein
MRASSWRCWRWRHAGCSCSACAPASRCRWSGLAPAAARYAGFSSRRALWTALLVSGGAAGLAGAFEVAGPLGQLTPYVPAGYGFAAIIVAYVRPPASRRHRAGPRC